jgi:tRNA 2-thiouridine synthesizing protein C
MSGKVAMLMRKAPYGSVYPAEGFRAMMGVAVFELDLCVIFLDDGVNSLVKGQDPSALDMKPLGEGFPTLPDVGIKEFYVHDRSLAERGLAPEDLVLPAQVVGGPQIEEILAGCTAVLPF